MGEAEGVGEGDGEGEVPAINCNLKVIVNRLESHQA